MTKIRLKQIEKISLTSDIKNGGVLSYNSDGNFEDKYFIADSQDGGLYSIPVRDSSGNIRVGEASSDNDAVNLATLNEKLSEIDISSMISDSNTVNSKYDEVTGKTSFNVIPAGLSGNIQKNLNGELAPCSYIYEDISKGSIEIARSSMYKDSSLESPVLLIVDIKAKGKYTSDIAIDASSYELDKGCKVVASTARQNSNNEQMIYKDFVKNGQSLFLLSINGYDSTTTSKESVRFEALAASDYSSGSANAIFKVSQIVGGEMKDVVLSNASGDIFISGGIAISDSSNGISGMVRFNGEHFQGYKNSGWVNLDIQSTEGTAISSDIIVTTDCGGYSIGDTVSAGTTFDELVSKLLAPYVKPSFSDFSVTGLVNGDSYNDSVIGVGVSFTPTFAELKCVKGSDGEYADSCKISGSGFDDAGFTPSESDITVDSNVSEIVSYSEPHTEEWTISGTDKDGNPVSFKYSMDWVYTAYFGASSEESPSIGSLQQMQYIKDGSVSFMCTSDNANANNYTFLAIPSDFEEDKTNMIIRRNCLNVTGAFTRTTIPASSSTNNIEYVLYRSNAKGAFSSGNTVRIK